MVQNAKFSLYCIFVDFRSLKCNVNDENTNFFRVGKQILHHEIFYYGRKWNLHLQSSLCGTSMELLQHIIVKICTCNDKFLFVFIFSSILFELFFLIYVG